MQQLILYGNGSVAAATYHQFRYDTSYEVVAFTVDHQFIKQDSFHDLPLIPFEKVADHYSPENYAMHIAVGYVHVNKVRAERFYQAKRLGYRLVSYVSSHAITWPGLQIGENCKIGTACTINPFATLGNDVHIGSGSNVGHHTTIGDHCTLASNVTIAGNVTVEPFCVIGANATIRDRVTIARACVIGAGAVILENTQERQVYLGRSAELLPLASDQLPLS